MCHQVAWILGAAPMSTPSFAGVTVESAILNYFMRYANPVIIEQHFDTGRSNSVMGWTAVGFVAAIELSTVIL
jgi:hypothetical protein